MEDVTAGEVRARTFRQALRGFDQDEVTRYLEVVADYLEALQQQLHLVGLSEVGSPHDLAAEYHAVGDEVARVLEEARTAADGMRARAAADTARWRNETEEATRAARQSVWETGTEMLEQVMAQCETLLAEAQETSFRLRSEAERDAARMLTDAQREREALTRVGREEGEQIVTAARKEADTLLMGARHQADVAQERTRALEKRRTELMGELESAQKELLGIEDEAAVELVEEPAPAPASEPEPTRSHWPEDDGVVRIVTAQRQVLPEPVDADALAAEVEAMREQAAPPSPPAVSQPEEPPEPEPEAPEEAIPPEEVVASESLPEDSPGDDAVAADAEPDQRPDPLAGLFHELRTSKDSAPAPQSPNGQPEQEVEAAVVVLPRGDEEPDTPDESIETLETTDPFALRDRLLLPVQNRALRLVKRQLVAAQNRALEELRLDAEWTPDAGLMNGEIAGVLVELVEESAAAGVAAAAELLGRTDGARPDIELDEPGEAFTAAFVDAATLSLERSRSAGAGKRETSSSLSRVFRAWRTDDAERRVRFVSRSAYHTGLLAALQAMDCDRVAVVPFGRSCADHGDAPEHWLIASGPPPGSLVPPASLECSCAVIPDC